MRANLGISAGGLGAEQGLFSAGGGSGNDGGGMFSVNTNGMVPGVAYKEATRAEALLKEGAIRSLSRSVSQADKPVFKSAVRYLAEKLDDDENVKKVMGIWVNYWKAAEGDPDARSKASSKACLTATDPISDALLSFLGGQLAAASASSSESSGGPMDALRRRLNELQMIDASFLGFLLQHGLDLPLSFLLLAPHVR